MQNGFPEIHVVFALLGEEDLLNLAHGQQTLKRQEDLGPPSLRTFRNTHLFRRVQTPLVRPLPPLQARDTNAGTVFRRQVEDAENV